MIKQTVIKYNKKRPVSQIKISKILMFLELALFNYSCANFH